MKGKAAPVAFPQETSMPAANTTINATQDPDRLDWADVRDGYLQPAPADAGTPDNQ